MHLTNRLPRAVFGAVALAVLLGPLALAGRAQPMPIQPEEIGKPRTAALVVPINGTQRVQMYTKRPIKNVENPKETVARVQPIQGVVDAVLIVGLEPGITHITLFDVDGKKEDFDVVVQFDVEYLRNLLKRTAPTAIVDPVPGANNTIILTGTVAHVEDIDIIMRTAASVVGGTTGTGAQRIINALRVGGVQQVELCVVLAQVNRTEERQMGFDWLLSSHNTIIGSQTAGAVGSVSPIGLMSTTLGPNGNLTDAIGTINGAATNALFGVLNPDHRWAYLQFLNALRNENLAKLLAEPRLVTLSGKEANFLSGGQTPVPTAGGLGVGGTDFVPFGTSLNFLPIVLGNGRIYLEVETEVSELGGVGSAVNINGSLVQSRNTERVRTAVELEPGQTLMIGGLIQRTTTTSATKLPVLGDVPFFGVFFRNIFSTEAEQELVIMVTPHLVDGMSCDQVPKLLPGQETRTPDDFELFLEGILEAPRGQREPFAGCCYHAAWTTGPTADKFPCGGHCLGIFGHPGSDGCCGGCGSVGLGGGCSKGGCGGCANGSCGAGNAGGESGLDAPPPFPSGMPQQSLPNPAGMQQTSIQEFSPPSPRASGMGPRPVVLPSDAGRR